ncbi:MAG: DUF3343 domain-containing protein [Desulfosoma sp.]
MLRFLKKFVPRKTKGPETTAVDRGLLVFENTSEVIQAEKHLKSLGYTVTVKGPPPEIQKGCDLVIEFPLMEKLTLERHLATVGLVPLAVVPVTAPLLEPVSLFHTKDYGSYLMVRAANMKITVDKKSLRIVNISGGGCPDVPYLAEALVGKSLHEAPQPRDLGHTLCGYALQLAYEELRRQCS